MARGDMEAVCARPDLAAEHVQPIQAREPQVWRENPPNRGNNTLRSTDLEGPKRTAAWVRNAPRRLQSPRVLFERSFGSQRKAARQPGRGNWA